MVSFIIVIDIEIWSCCMLTHNLTQLPRTHVFKLKTCNRNSDMEILHVYLNQTIKPLLPTFGPVVQPFAAKKPIHCSYSKTIKPTIRVQRHTSISLHNQFWQHRHNNICIPSKMFDYAPLQGLFNGFSKLQFSHFFLSQIQN